MTEELVKELISIVRDSKSFILGQAPEVIQQVLKYKTIAAFIATGESFAFLILGLFLLKMAFLETKKDFHNQCDEIIILGSIGGITFGGVSFVCLVASIMTLIQIHIAPKVFLLEYLRGLGK